MGIQPAADALHVDVAIRGGRVIDGSGKAAFEADVGVRGNRITHVGRNIPLEAERVIDATGHVVCPGFIDLHSHGDLVLLDDPHCAAKFMQGVTTEVIGQDGLSYAPVTDRTLRYFRNVARALNGDPQGLDWSWRSVAEYLERFHLKTAVNVAFLVPHGPIRAAVIGLENRAATEAELDQMKELVDLAMRQGALGFSTGLTYAPCSYADSRELVELCKAVAPHGGYFAAHIRCYGAKMEAAVEEVIQVATEADLPLHLTHFHVWGKARPYLERIDRARQAGLDLTMDVYPYLAGSTFLAGLLPGWAHTGGSERLLARLADAETRERIRQEMEVTGSDGLSGMPVAWETIVLTGVDAEKHVELVGLNFDEISRRLGRPPFECAADLLIENDLTVSCLIFCGNEENFREIFSHPACMAGSDGLLVGQRPHPRAYGTFARLLGRYVRELGLLSLEECVSKMTMAAARRLGLADRGLIRPNMAADLVVFDPHTVEDTATYEDPRRHPTGIPYVMVEGQLVKDQNQPTGRLAGCVPRRRR